MSTDGMVLVNGPDVMRRLGNVVPELTEDLTDTNREITELLVNRTRGTLAGVFSQRAGSGLRAGTGPSGDPAVMWGGGAVFSGGGTIDELWGAAEWGSSVYPHLPPRREAGHLFATVESAERELLGMWTDTAVDSLRATVR
jgi:hypothetical protein